MKIAIDIREAGGEKAGKGFYTFNLVRALLKIDRRNQYILYTKNLVPGFEEFENAEQRAIKGAGIFWHHNVKKDLQRIPPDIYFAPTSYIIPALLSKDIPSIITIHDLVAFLFPSVHQKKAVVIEKVFLRRALKKVKFICTISENTKKDILENFDYSASQIDIVSCSASDKFKAIPEENLKDFAQKTNLPKKFFLAVGTLEPRKNYQTLIKAFDILQKKHPDTHLVIVGGKGWKYQKIFNLIEKRDLTKKVHALGYVSESSLVNLYNLAQALVFPSLYEGFGIPPLEAMKSKCPVITSNSSSLPEVVGEAGILIDPNSPHEIAKAMAKIIDDPQHTEELKEKGIQKSQKFSWEASAKKLLHIFEKNCHNKNTLK
jgi:glycosyltransferase involved in cell wall biosynthesis